MPSRASLSARPRPAVFAGVAPAAGSSGHDGSNPAGYWPFVWSKASRQPVRGLALARRQHENAFDLDQRRLAAAPPPGTSRAPGTAGLKYLAMISLTLAKSPKSAIRIVELDHVVEARRPPRPPPHAGS